MGLELAERNCRVRDFSQVRGCLIGQQLRGLHDGTRRGVRAGLPRASSPISNLLGKAAWPISDHCGHETCSVRGTGEGDLSTFAVAFVPLSRFHAGLGLAATISGKRATLVV